MISKQCSKVRIVVKRVARRKLSHSLSQSAWSAAYCVLRCRNCEICAHDVDLLLWSFFKNKLLAVNHSTIPLFVDGAAVLEGNANRENVAAPAKCPYSVLHRVQELRARAQDGV